MIRNTTFGGLMIVFLATVLALVILAHLACYLDNYCPPN